MATEAKRVPQCQKPSGWLGRFVVRNMNSRHSKVTDWGLSNLAISGRDTILDVGCGGGRTISKLAAVATEGRVFGLDYSDVSVSVATKLNAHWIKTGRVEIYKGSVLQLPFPADMFDLVTAVETHFWWSDLPGGMREVWRVLKPGGALVIVAEVYRGAKTVTAKLLEINHSKIGMKLLSPSEHRALFVDAGFADVQIVEQTDRGWICGMGKKLP